ncbi:YtxH domain-containing protein [Paenibacillus xanthanilyticus]|uniref:YtxH domain-containing protein n=1 Tax=Paenibacillus xanthanilyticus TaxID=1783531 RepID=A0ABV8KAQ5_9BACL
MANAMKGLLIGGAIGAVTALLVTPKNGKEMRESLKMKSSELTASARERASLMAAQAADKAAAARERVNEFGKVAAEKVATAAESTAGVFQNMKNDAQADQENNKQTLGSSPSASSSTSTGSSTGTGTATPSHAYQS